MAVITQISPIDVEFSIPQDQVPEVQARTMGIQVDSATRQTAQASDKPAGGQHDGGNDRKAARSGKDNKDSKDGQDAGKVTPLGVIALDRSRVNTLDQGRFLALDNQVDTQTGTVKAKARFPNDKLNLFPSQFVNVKLLLHTIQNAVVIPVTALRHGSKGDFVYVLNTEDRTVALRPVTRGQATVEKVEVTSGLQPGEKVITEGADRLKDGARVTLPGDRAGGKGGANGAAGAGGASGVSGASGEPGKGKGRHKPAAAGDTAAAPASDASATGASGASSAAGAASAASGAAHRRRQQEASSQ